MVRVTVRRNRKRPDSLCFKNNVFESQQLVLPRLYSRPVTAQNLTVQVFFFVLNVVPGMSQMGDGDLERHPSRRYVDHRRRDPELHQRPVED